MDGLGRGFVHPPGIPGTGSGQPFSGMAGGTAPGRCCDAADLETEPENERAQELYYRLGYENLNYLQMIKRLDEENA